MQRYFDGVQWTEKYAPAVAPQAAGVVMTGETSHWLHSRSHAFHVRALDPDLDHRGTQFKQTPDGR
jgi:hypothetical protein